MSNLQTEDSIVSMRSILFSAMRALGDKENPMELDRAKAISDMAQVIINSAKVEVDALKIIGGTGSGFIPALAINKPSPLSIVDKPQPGVMNHRMRG